MMIIEEPKEPLPCNPECCEEEWEHYVKLQKAKIPPDPLEHVLDIEEPIKVFLFDMPRATYSNRVWAVGIYTAANFVIGCLCFLTFLYAYISGPFCGDKYSKLTKKLHVPLEALAVLLHGSLGILALSQYYDSSHMLKWKDRRTQHEKHMFYSVIIFFTDMALYFTCHDTSKTVTNMKVKNAVCPCDTNMGLGGFCLCPTCHINYLSLHLFMGAGAFIGYTIATVTGIFLFVYLGRGSQGARGQDTLMSDVHTASGLAAYFFSLAALCTSFLYSDFNLWMKQNYGPHTELMVMVLAAYLFVISIIGPGYRAIGRFKTYREKSKVRREVEDQILMDEIDMKNELKKAKNLNIMKERANKKRARRGVNKKKKDKKKKAKKGKI